MSELPPPDPHAEVVVVAEPVDEANEDGRLESFVFREPRLGDLTPGWRVVMIATWIAVFFAFAGVWKASEEIGIGTWWLGSRSQPTVLPVRLIPFLLAFVLAVLATYNLRRLPLLALGGAVGVAVIGVFDFRWSAGLAIVELLIAVGAVLVAVASFGGRYVGGEAATSSGSPGSKSPITH